MFNITSILFWSGAQAEEERLRSVPFCLEATPNKLQRARQCKTRDSSDDERSLLRGFFFHGIALCGNEIDQLGTRVLQPTLWAAGRGTLDRNLTGFGLRPAA